MMLFMMLGLAHAQVVTVNNMGDVNCPCTGDISLIPPGQLNKELGYGTYCTEWDIELAYCTEEEAGTNQWNEGYEWCGDKWCYVDRNNCNDVQLDDGSIVDPLFQPSVIYPQIPLYFSYNTCGNADQYKTSGTVWIWDFGECDERDPNDYYMLIDSSASVLDEWADVKVTLAIIMKEALYKKDDDRVGMVMFAGKRDFAIKDTVTVFDFDDDYDTAIDAMNDMENLEGQTWTLLGMQKTVELWSGKPVLDTPGRRRILCLITDGRPKPRTTASDAPGDTAEPGCIEQMLDNSLRLCVNGEKPHVVPCRPQHCSDINMETTDCCPGDQNPCTSDEKDALIQALKDQDIQVAVIAVGKDANNIKSAPYDCDPPLCTPGGPSPCVCSSDIYYFDCLLTPGYDQSADPVPHRITTISSFSNFLQYKDPTASTEGGKDGAICVNPLSFSDKTVAPTSSCFEIPEPKNSILVLDSSKSMYTKKNRGSTAAANWLSVMQDLQNVVCLYNPQADPAFHRCAFGLRDNVGLVRFATQHKVEWDFNLPGQWWSNVRFTKFENSVVVSNLPRKELNYMTDTVAALWEGWNMMERMDPDTYTAQNGDEVPKRREIILITDGRPHCKRDPDTLCRPCAPAYREETLLKENLADANLKIIWRGDRQTHDGTISVDKAQLADDEWFGCLTIDFDDPEQFVLVENFHEDTFRDALLGNLVCAQQN